jgi:hypothetical protein
MEQNGYHVYTLDNKHGRGCSMRITESNTTPVCIRASSHCNNDFCDIRVSRSHESIEQTWGTQKVFKISCYKVGADNK